MPKDSRLRKTKGLGGFSQIEVLILSLFFFSGASALVYEVVWSRSLTYVFGGSAFAIATVLAAYMAGLALGSTVLGRWIDRKGHPLAIYGLLELGIAAWALLLPTLLGLFDRLYADIYRSIDPGFQTLSLIRFVLSFALLLVPTTLMGGTLPVLGKLLLVDFKGLGTRAGLLYGINTLGAVLGVALGGFALVPALGLNGATWVAVIINVVVGVAAILAAKRHPYDRPDAPSAAAASEAHDSQAPPRLRRAVLAVYAASGFAALAYEVAWTKTLTMVLGTTTYAFTTMLTTFLLGLSLGSFVFGKIADRVKRPQALLVLVQSIIPLTAVLSIPILHAMPQTFVDLYPSVRANWLAVEGVRFMLSAGAMFVPTFFMGGMFPLVTRVYMGKHTEGKSLGTLYAANTLGAILGSFAAGFVLIPLIGRQNSILAATLVNVAAVILLASVLRWRRVGKIWAFAVAGTLMLTVLIMVTPGPWNPVVRWNPRIMASGAYVYAGEYAQRGKILDVMNDVSLLFYDEATEGTVSVWHGEYILSLRTSGKVEASSYGDMVTQKMIAHLPLLYHQGQPREGVMIGLASGISVGSMLTHDLERVETIELIPSMEEVARIFGRFNYDCLDDPRHHLVLNDGRNHLLLTDRTYDIIISEPSNPWIAGVGSLFTQEFFELTKKRLNPGGVVCQWVQLYHFSEDDFRTVLATFVDAYPYIHLWEGASGDVILVCSLEPLALNQQTFEKALAGRPGEDFADLETMPMAQILSRFVTDRDGLMRYLNGWPGRVTDDNLYLEFSVPRHMAATTAGVTQLTLDPVRLPITTALDSAWQPDSTLQGDIMRFRLARSTTLGATLGLPLPPGVPDANSALWSAYRTAPRELLTRHEVSQRLNQEAVTLLTGGQVQESANLLNLAVETGDRGEQAMAWNNLGTIAFRSGGLDSARAYWNHAIEAQPLFTTVSYNLALLDAREGNFAQAVRQLEYTLSIDPHMTDALNNLAYYSVEAGLDLEKAEAAARKAVAQSSDAITRDTLAYVLLHAKKYEEASSILRALLKEDPTAYESLLHLGMVHVGQGQPEKAREAFDIVVQQAQRQTLRDRAQEELDRLSRAQ